NGSACGAVTRSTRCIANTSTARLPATRMTLVSTAPFTPSCTSAIEAPLMPHATSTRMSSRLRRRAGWRSRTRMLVVSVAAEAVSVVMVKPVDDVASVVEVAGGDGVEHLATLEIRERVNADARLGVDLGERDRPDALLHPLEDRDRVAVRAHVVAGLRPAVADDETRHDQRGDEPDRDEPGHATTDGAAPVLSDELLQVLVGLGLEVAVLRRGLEGVQEKGGQAQGLAARIRFEAERKRGGTDRDGRVRCGVGRVVDVDHNNRDVVRRALVEA